MQHNPLYDLLHSAKVSDVVTQRTIISLDSEDTVENAVKKLAQNHIQSAPVVNDKTKEVLGMVDMLDIVAFILSVLPTGHQLHANDLKRMEIAGRAMALESLKNVVGTMSSPFSHLLVPLLCSSTTIHRLLRT